MEETSDSAITGQSILSKTQVCSLSARNCLRVFQKRNNRRETFCCGIPGGKSFLFFSFSFSHLHFSFLICHFSFLLCPLSFVLCPFSFVLSPFSFLLCHFPFVLSPFSRLSHFVAQISANVNIYRIDSSFLHIICAFLA